MAFLKKCFIRCLCLTLALSMAAADALAESPVSPGMEYLSEELESAASLLMEFGQDVDNFSTKE